MTLKCPPVQDGLSPMTSLPVLPIYHCDGHGLDGLWLARVPLGAASKERSYLI